MGWNTTVVIMNDALGYIEKDPDFAKNLCRAVCKAVSKKDCPVRVAARGFSPAAVVIETHHADYYVNVKVGGNTGKIISDEDFVELAVAGNERLIGVSNIAKRLSVSSQTVRNWISSGKLRAYRVSRNWFVWKEDLRKFMEARTGHNEQEKQ